MTENIIEEITRNEKLELITFWMPRKYSHRIQSLVEQGEFLNRSDFIRYVVRRYLDDTNLFTQILQG